MHDLTQRMTVSKKFMYIPNRRQALLEVAAREQKNEDDWLGGEVDKIAENAMEIVEVRLAEEQRLREALAAVQADQLAILEEARLQIVGEPVVRGWHSWSHGLLAPECDRRRAADHRASTGSAKDQPPVRSKNNADLNNVILPEFDGMLTLRKIYWN
eukprot:599572_1